jgi:Domain of unknown function (DUF4175)
MSGVDGSVNSSVPRNAGEMLERALRRAPWTGLAQQLGQGQGPGPNGQPGRLGPGRAQQDTDSLGRPLRGRHYGDDTTVKEPGEIDAQRAPHP